MRMTLRSPSPRSLYAAGTLLLAFSTAVWAQAPRAGRRGGAQGDASHAVANGGIKVAGWHGQVDPAEAKRGMKVDQALFDQQGDGLHSVTGPAISYWKTGDTASGDYTVKATFTEPKFMNLNTHPHPYGVFIAGNAMGTPDQTELYCAAYGNGTFIVRGFGPAPFQMGGYQPEANAAVHKAAAPGQPVSQEVALSVNSDKVSCAINGTVVASYPKSELVGAGKLRSLDGAYGLRFAHNTEVNVTGFTVTKP